MLVREQAPLAPLTTLGLGGPARRLVTAYDEDEVVRAVLDAGREDVLVLGGGSNVVVADEGFGGTVVHLASHGLAARRDGDDVLLTAQAGEDWDGLVAHSVREGLAGLEALSGIPGSVGATPVQNVGAYGADVSQTVDRVRALDRSSRRVVELTARQCAFGYRASRFKSDSERWVVLAVTYRLGPGPLGAPVRYAELARALGVELGECAPLTDVRSAVLALRRGKGMVVDPDDPDSRSAGSFFTNPVLTGAELAVFAERVRARLGDVHVPGHPDGNGRTKLSAAWLIQHAGFDKGTGDGAVGLSGKHVLALVNRGGGTTAELLALARRVRDGVCEAFGIELVPEPVLVGGARL
ncbi:MAG: UDP-N-acetylmuramate dehydrogenase [Actinomycetota bacterium]|nr:UDP-N-acetylmuramate dehydrogenase [Actinomycetota bacterium]